MQSIFLKQNELTTKVAFFVFRSDETGASRLALLARTFSCSVSLITALIRGSDLMTPSAARTESGSYSNKIQKLWDLKIAQETLLRHFRLYIQRIVCLYDFNVLQVKILHIWQ